MALVHKNQISSLNLKKKFSSVGNERDDLSIMRLYFLTYCTYLMTSKTIHKNAADYCVHVDSRVENSC